MIDIGNTIIYNDMKFKVIDLDRTCQTFYIRFNRYTKPFWVHKLDVTLEIEIEKEINKINFADIFKIKKMVLV
jgi:hypothetical protein